MIIRIDSREQQKLDFSGIKEVEKVEVSGLNFGDYSATVGGKVIPIAWERKSLQDCFSTLTSGHARFKRELERAKKANFKLILMVEGTYTDVWKGCEYSQTDGPTLIKIMNTMYVKYDLEFKFCESRRVMARQIVDLASAVERSYS